MIQYIRFEINEDMMDMLMALRDNRLPFELEAPAKIKYPEAVALIQTIKTEFDNFFEAVDAMKKAAQEGYKSASRAIKRLEDSAFFMNQSWRLIETLQNLASDAKTKEESIIQRLKERRAALRNAKARIQLLIEGMKKEEEDAITKYFTQKQNDHLPSDVLKATATVGIAIRIPSLVIPSLVMGVVAMGLEPVERFLLLGAKERQIERLETEMELTSGTLQSLRNFGDILTELIQLVDKILGLWVQEHFWFEVILSNIDTVLVTSKLQKRMWMWKKQQYDAYMSNIIPVIGPPQVYSLAQPDD
ncbi:hypothetical protein FRC17_009343 [Serendipita sp. 399]|nr:hypothetical protein FRC17_009343 [Serendipita sp. 399]